MARRVLAEFDAIDGPFLRKMNRIDRSINNFERRATTGFARVERGVDSIVASASRLRVLNTVLVAGFGTRLSVQFVDQAKQIRNALKEAGDASEETFNRIFRASARSLTGFKEFTLGVQRFQKALDGQQNIGQSIRQIETLNKLLALSGKSTQERESTFIQFSQALQSGVLQGEELRAIRENAPIELTRAIAEGAGGSIQDLKELAKQGKITTDVMIGALTRLEEEADRRFSEIEITIGDAQKVFSNGLLVIAESFDNGLGATDAVANLLRSLGETLGDTGDAFEVFGKVVKYAGAAYFLAFNGRRLAGVSRSLRETASARLADAAAADKQVIASRRALAAATASRDAAIARNAALIASSASESQIIQSTNAVASAQTRWTQATVRNRVAVEAMNRAQGQLIFTTRALTKAGAAARAAFAFFGGWVGVALTLVTVFGSLIANIETASERMKRLTANTDDIRNAREALLDVQFRLNEAIKAAADASDAATARELENTKKQFAAKQELLAAENVLALQRKAQIQNEISDIQNQLKVLKESIAESDAIETRDIFSFTAKSTKGSEQEAVREGEARLIKLRKTLGDLNVEIRQNMSLLEKSLDEINIEVLSEDDQRDLEQATEFMQKFVKSQETANERVAATIKEVAAARETLLDSGKFDETSQEIKDLDAALERYQDQMAGAKTKTDEMTSAALALKNALDSIDGIQFNAAVSLGAAQTRLRAVQAGLSAQQADVRARAFEQSARLSQAGVPLDKIQQLREQAIATGDAIAEANQKVADLLNGRGTGGGSGAGSSGEGLADFEQKALSVIESVRTAEERQQETLRETIELRQYLVAQYGQETALTLQLAEAIDRMKEGFDDGIWSQQQFFDQMSNSITSSIDEWRGWGEFVRNILSSLVQTYGPAFFTALLTPGSQGDDFGSVAGDFLAGVFHSGGKVGQGGATRRVPASTFAGAPRFHNGLFPNLKPGEMPAILERGETVIPKGVAISGGSQINVFNDFRGADQSMRAELEAKMTRFEVEFQGRVLQANRANARSRVW